MKKLSLALASASLLASAAPALAADAAASPHSVSGNFTLASEYLYRGIAQTRGKPAIQGGVDYAHASGVYVGVWGSNISWIGDTLSDSSGTPSSASMEIDVYGGYKGAINDDFGYDVGVLTYNYPGSNKPSGAAKPDTTELYGALSWKWLTLKYSQTTGSLFGWTKTADGGKTKGSAYTELNAAYDLGGGWGINGHVGHQKVKGNTPASYSDYKLGVTKDVGFGSVSLAYSSTNAKDNCADFANNPYCFGTSNGGNTADYEAGKSRLVVSFSKSF